jgi:hypothetical protein
MTDKKPTGLDLLREPFPAHQISKLPKPFKKDSPKGKCAECGGYHGLPAVHLDYVGHAALTDRLLDADPAWFWEPLAMSPTGLPVMDGNGGMWIKLTVCGITRLGYGHPDGKTGGNAIKEVIGDALRNAAMRFGAALDLWHRGDLHADEDDDQPVTEQKREPPSQKQPATPAQIADRLIQRFGEFTTVADLETFTGPDEPAGKAWDRLAKDNAAESDRVKVAYLNRIKELEQAA